MNIMSYIHESNYDYEYNGYIHEYNYLFLCSYIHEYVFMNIIVHVRKYGGCASCARQ